MMKQIDFSDRIYKPGDEIGNAEIISLLGDSWDERFDTFWHLRLRFRDALEKHLRREGVKATCRIMPGGDGVEICEAGKALDYQIRRRKSGCRKIRRAMEGLQQGVDPNALTESESVRLDREQRVAVSQYLAVKRQNDLTTLLSSSSSDRTRREMT